MMLSAPFFALSALGGLTLTKEGSVFLAGFDQITEQG